MMWCCDDVMMWWCDDVMIWWCDGVMVWWCDGDCDDDDDDDVMVMVVVMMMIMIMTIVSVEPRPGWREHVCYYSDYNMEFPKIGLPPNHPNLGHFSIETHGNLGIIILGNTHLSCGWRWAWYATWPTGLLTACRIGGDRAENCGAKRLSKGEGISKN